VPGSGAQEGFTITQVLNTHEHLDHTAGNAEVVAATGARVSPTPGAANRIGGSTGAGEGDVIKVGRTVELEALDTAGHTRSHVCLLAHGDAPALFCGDTLFNAGAGNCHNGGDPGLLYETFVNQLAKLPDNTRVYPGHEYMARNLAFTLDREPGNADAAHALASARAHEPTDARVTTWPTEKRVNAFLRLQNPKSSRSCVRDFPKSARHPMHARCS
jgi:hydroxyacylglutathione hydrolase